MRLQGNNTFELIKIKFPELEDDEIQQLIENLKTDCIIQEDARKEENQNLTQVQINDAKFESLLANSLSIVADFLTKPPHHINDRVKSAIKIIDIGYRKV